MSVLMFNNGRHKQALVNASLALPNIGSRTVTEDKTGNTHFSVTISTAWSYSSSKRSRFVFLTLSWSVWPRFFGGRPLFLTTPNAGTRPGSFAPPRRALSDNRMPRIRSCEDCGSGRHFLRIVVCEMCRICGERCANVTVLNAFADGLRARCCASGLDAPMVTWVGMIGGSSGLGGDRGYASHAFGSCVFLSQGCSICEGYHNLDFEWWGMHFARGMGGSRECLQAERDVYLAGYGLA